MDILFSLFNVNFIEYQMKCFSFLKEYLKHGDLSDVLQLLKIFIYLLLFFNKEQTLSFFFIEKQVSGKKSISVVLTWTMFIH